MFCQKSIFKNFAKFTGMHLCQSFIFNKVAEKKRKKNKQKQNASFVKTLCCTMRKSDVSNLSEIQCRIETFKRVTKCIRNYMKPVITLMKVMTLWCKRRWCKHDTQTFTVYIYCLLNLAINFAQKCLFPTRLSPATISNFVFKGFQLIVKLKWQEDH